MMNRNRNIDFDILKKSERNEGKELKRELLINEKRNGKDILNDHQQSKIKDVICFSHLRWNFVFQRPQHLLSRWAKECRVFYIEEPVQGKFDSNYLKTIHNGTSTGLTIITPHVKDTSSEVEITNYLKKSVNQIVEWYKISDYLLWYLTPMAVQFTSDLKPKVIVYDSMDELSCFKGAHPNMLTNENNLFKLADVVFTGGYNLYEYKKDRHHNIYPFPSSVDQKHFRSGLGGKDPEDQALIPHPRVGFFGVLDERLDIELLDGLALKMPDIQFLMVGPVVKIDPASLPKHSNIHYLGQKTYNELPLYLANWDVAFLPFARNESTRFISPTKTPEYLCAGKPVVSTSIHDVVTPYGELGLVEIADNVNDFSDAITRILERKDKTSWQLKVKEHLNGNSWDLTWQQMREVIYKTIKEKESAMKMLFLNK